MAAGHSDGGSEEKTVSLRLTGHRQDARLVRIDAAHCECVSPCPRDSALCKHIVRGGQRVAGDERARCPRTFDTVGTRSNRRSPFHLSKALPRSPSADRPLWRSERIALSAAACGFFRRRHVKVFVNTAAHEEMRRSRCTYRCLQNGCLLCVTDRRPPAGQSTCQSGARSTASGSRPSVGVPPPAEKRAAGAASGELYSRLFKIRNSGAHTVLSSETPSATFK